MPSEFEDDEVPAGRVPSLWDLYADVKYWSAAANGPRKVDGSVSLGELSRALVNVLEAAWRQGHRNEALRLAAAAELRRRRKKRLPN